jgi:hypothetical protein
LIGLGYGGGYVFLEIETEIINISALIKGGTEGV